LTQRELSRLTCRRDAGATIFFTDQRLRGEIGFGCGWTALCSSVFIGGFVLVAARLQCVIRGHALPLPDLAITKQVTIQENFQKPEPALAD